MNISDIARKTGLSGKAIRFYEEKGIITLRSARPTAIGIMSVTTLKN